MPPIKIIDKERMIKSQLKYLKFNLDAFKDRLEGRWKILMDLESLGFHTNPDGQITQDKRENPIMGEY